MNAAGAGLLLAAFGIGSIPFGLLIGRLAAGIDVRTRGSGNLGATNVLRVVGPRWGVLTLLLDVGKGALAVAALPLWLGVAECGDGALWPMAAGLAAVAGHCFSPWVGFRGGKGVATAVGVYFCAAPWAAALAVAAFGLTLLIWRYVSLASLAMAACYPLGVLLVGPAGARGGPALLGLALLLLIGWTHRANWRRIAAGEEAGIGGGR